MDTFEFAVKLYSSLVPRTHRGSPILNDVTRAAVAEILHSQHPTWCAHFNLDDIERAVWMEGTK